MSGLTDKQLYVLDTMKPGQRLNIEGDFMSLFPTPPYGAKDDWLSHDQRAAKFAKLFDLTIWEDIFKHEVVFEKNRP
jgi:hypothetical protein